MLYAFDHLILVGLELLSEQACALQHVLLVLNQLLLLLHQRGAPGFFLGHLFLEVINCHQLTFATILCSDFVFSATPHVTEVIDLCFIKSASLAKFIELLHAHEDDLLCVIILQAQGPGSLLVSLASTRLINIGSGTCRPPDCGSLLLSGSQGC